MKLFGYTPIDYFNRWLAEPIMVADGESVQSIINALNRHPLAQETAQDYVMPPGRYRERADRFRILGENQDVWYCFVYDGAETLRDPPVYFETCLNLERRGRQGSPSRRGRCRNETGRASAACPASDP